MKRRVPVQISTWTRRSVLLLETGIILFWVGMALQNERIAIASGIIFTYLILSLAFTTDPNHTASIQRRLLIDRVLEEQPVQIDTIIRNDSSSPVLIQGSESFPASLYVAEGSPSYLIFIGPKASAFVREVIKADFRGHYVIPPATVRSIDEFGLRERIVHGGRDVYISVIPPIEDLSDFSLESRSAQPEIGTFRSSSVGVGTEFFGIRNYLPGDELRKINWKASARTDSLLSNEYEREHVTNIYLFVDLTAPQIEALKWTVRTAASIATYLLRTRNRLGLVVLGESTSHVQIESGRRQLLRVLDKLITAEPGGTGESSTYLIRLLEEMPRCEILFVSALSSDAVSKTVLAIRGKHERLTVITRVPNVPEAREGDLVLKAATLIHSLQRRAIIQRLRNSEVKVIEVPFGRSIRSAVSMIQERPMRH